MKEDIDSAFEASEYRSVNEWLCNVIQEKLDRENKGTINVTSMTEEEFDARIEAVLKKLLAEKNGDKN